MVRPSPVVLQCLNCCYMVASQRLADSMKVCSKLGIASHASRLHAHLVVSGFLPASVFLSNHLIDLYAKLGLLGFARLVFDEIPERNAFSWNILMMGFADWGRTDDSLRLFDEIPEGVRDAVSWNTVIAGCVQNGRREDGLNLFVRMLRCFDHAHNSFSLVSAVNACSSLSLFCLGSQIHGLSIKLDSLIDNHSVQCSLVNMYITFGDVKSAQAVFDRMYRFDLLTWNSMMVALSKVSGPDPALQLFLKMPERDVISWNTIISIMSQHDHGVECLNLFKQMSDLGWRPNGTTYASTLRACTSLYCINWGKHLHARILCAEHHIDVYVGSSLVDMYSKCGLLDSARQVLDLMSERNTVSFTSMMAGFVQHEMEEEVLCSSRIW